MTNAEFMALAKKIVADYTNEHMDKTDKKEISP